MSNIIPKIEHGAANSVYDGQTNIEPNDTSCTDAHGVGITSLGNPAFALPPVICPTRHASITTLARQSNYTYTPFVDLNGAIYDANVLLDASLLSPYKMIVTANITANRTYQFPTAEDLVVLLGASLKAGSFWTVYFGANGGNITILTNTGITFRGNTGFLQININTHRKLGIRLTSLEPGAEAYECYIY